MTASVTDAQRRTLRVLSDGEWHESTRTGTRGTVLGTVAAALWRQGLVERFGSSRTAKPSNPGYRYRITTAGRAAIADTADLYAALGCAADHWIGLHGVPISQATSDNGFLVDAERVFWRVVKARGLMPVQQ